MFKVFFSEFVQLIKKLFGLFIVWKHIVEMILFSIISRIFPSVITIH